MTATSKPSFKVTATLLNSWNYIYQVEDDKTKEAYDSFLKTLARIKEPPNFFMLRGLEFEKDCYNGLIPDISKVIRDGAYQVYVEKQMFVDPYNVKLVGVLDVLKEGVIYDIKRVNQYDLQKYYTSYQHHIYFELVEDADKFVYLVAAGTNNDYVSFYQEEYTRAEKIDLVKAISQFYQFLRDNGLWETYKKNWEINNTGETL
jgi:hypothetical protein